MRRHSFLLLVPLVGLALVCLAKARNAPNPAVKKVELVNYPLPSSTEAVGEVASKADRAVLDDFYRSHALADEDRASATNDADLLSSVIAERGVNSDERFGRGVILSKTAFVANFRRGGHHFTRMQHDHVRMVPCGPNTVVVTGRSTSILHYGGRLSPGPRLLTEVWVKLDGRWQRAVHAMSDLEEGMEPRADR